MQAVSDMLRDVMSRSEMGKKLFEGMTQNEGITQEQIMQRRIDEYNNTVGDLDKSSNGYSCAKCKNRGDIAALRRVGDSTYEIHNVCECMKIRKSIWRIIDSGLAESMLTQKLKTFVTEESWQEAMLSKARAFLQDGEAQRAWFYVGGQSGCGKTHLCTGIARELLYGGAELYYVVWEQISKELKVVINDAEYGQKISKLERVQVLYIDDLFKPVKDESGNVRAPSAADVKIAFELLNYRYINKLVTIISSEKFLNEIMEIDEALGSRIYERSKGYALAIERSSAKNYRRRDMVLI